MLTDSETLIGKALMDELEELERSNLGSIRAGAVRQVPFNGVVRIAEERDGSLSLLHSPMMNRQEAARYVGLGLNQFDKAGIRKRGTGHRGYHRADLDVFLERLGR